MPRSTRQDWNPRRVNHAPTHSNVLTAGVTTKLTPTNVRFGDTDSIENDTRKSMPRSVKTDQNQFILKKTALFPNDYQKPQNLLSKCLQELSHHQYNPRNPSTSSYKGEPFMSTCYHPNWISFTRIPSDNKDFPRVITYINIHLSSLRFLLCKHIFNHRDISLISFLNNNVCHYILNVYSNSSHSALKYFKDTEVNINNVILMTNDFNIRDSLWDSSFPFYSSISNDLIMIADSFDLVLSSPTNPCPTRYSNMVRESNSVIDLMFLRYGSSELDCHSILPNSHLSSDHAPLSINIPILKRLSKYRNSP